MKKAVKPKKNLWKRIVSCWELYLFLLPALVYFAIFQYGPLYGLQIAFKNYNPALGFLGSPWVGLKNFMNFFHGYYLWTLIRNTTFLSLYLLAAEFPLPIIFALMINEMRHKRYKKVIQTVTYIPNFISAVVMVGIIMLVLDPSSGIVNNIIKSLSGQSIDFLTKPSMFRNIYVWSDVWQTTGYSSIIYVAALSAVDMELHEAAVMDGASRLKRIWHINLPTIAPTIIILLILGAGQIMSLGIDKIYLLQNDLNLSVSQVIDTYVLRRGIFTGDYSFSAAVGMFNNVVNLILVVVFNFISRKFSDTSLF